jgi:hypothetical protein
MGKFDFLKSNIEDLSACNGLKSRHTFYNINEEEIIEAEQTMNRRFPKELRNFYLEIGYGFFCKDDTTRTNRIMHPNDIALYYVNDSEYEYVDKEIYGEQELIFFDLGGEGDFLTINIASENKDGKCEILYFGRKIASSLLNFLFNMNIKTNYYLEIKR